MQVYSVYIPANITHSIAELTAGVILTEIFVKIILYGYKPVNFH